MATRPGTQNHDWCALLASSGFSVLSMPMLALVPVGDAQQQNAVRQKILDFDLYDKVIFVSQNAVLHTREWLDQYWPQLPLGIEYFAVGKKTAQTLQQVLELSPEQVSSTALEMNTEGLLQHSLLQDVTHKKILICRGVGGRPLLGEALNARGAQVEYCELYLREIPELALAQLAQQKFDLRTDIISVFSGETLNNLLTVAAAVSVDKKAELLRLAILVPGERVAECAREAGFSRILTSQNASEIEMLETLQRLMNDGQNASS